MLWPALYAEPPQPFQALPEVIAHGL